LFSSSDRASFLASASGRQVCFGPDNRQGYDMLGHNQGVEGRLDRGLGFIEFALINQRRNGRDGLGIGF
jgi:hypothetical protein